MKVKIDSNGFLHLERAGKMKDQSCPYGKGNHVCGDWCPLFKETIYDGEGAMLEICHRTIITGPEDFTDERNKL